MRPGEGWVAGLRRFLQPASAHARCELCGVILAMGHAHVVDAAEDRMLCACETCARSHAEGAREGMLRVPDRVSRLTAFRLDDNEWSNLGIPVGIAFFVRSRRDGRVVARYPGAAGAMESLLDLDAWSSLERANPVLREFEPDVEALLVNHLDGAREYFRMPIDRCYALAGLIRSSWSGFTGGDAMRDTVRRFLAEPAATPPDGSARA